MAVVLCVSDLHSPFIHPRAFDFIRKLYKQEKPDEVVFLGDEVDCAAFSTHPKDPHMPAANDEMEAAIDALLPFYQAFPKAKICWSNHVLRPFKRAAESMLPEMFLRSWKEVIKAPKCWEWRDQWEIDGVAFRHGDGFSGKHANRSAVERMRQSVVIGHVHSCAGVSYTASPSDTIFGAAMGCLINPAHRAFAYGKYDTAKPIISAGVVYDGESAVVIRMPGV